MTKSCKPSAAKASEVAAKKKRGRPPGPRGPMPRKPKDYSGIQGDRLISIKETAARLNISVGTIYQYLNKGILKEPTRIGAGRVCFPLSYVLDIVQNGTKAAA